MSKVALVFGGSGAIGHETCKRLDSLGYITYFTYLKNEKKAMEIVHSSKNTIARKCDIRNERDVQKIILDVSKERKRIDVLINCAGISKESLFLDKSTEEWKDVLETNLYSVFYTCKATIPIMLEQYSGVIINISSILGMFGIPGMEDYCAAKSAIIGFSQSLAAEVARFGIRVNCISPGMIDTEMSKGAQNQIGKSVKRLIPCKEFGTAQDVVNLIEFLVSSKSNYITGENILIGGGLGKTLPVS